MNRGDVWWVDFGPPFGSEPGFRRPVIVMQAEPFNRSRIDTVIVVPMTTNTELAAAPGKCSLQFETDWASETVVGGCISAGGHRQ